MTTSDKQRIERLERLVGSLQQAQQEQDNARQQAERERELRARNLIK